MEESFIGEVEYCKHIHWLPCGWRRWRPIRGKGIFGAVHRAALYAFIENGFQHQEFKDKMVKAVGKWVKKGSQHFPQHYNDMKFFYNILKSDTLEEFVESYEEQSRKLDKVMFLVAKISIAQYVKTNKDWYTSEEQQLMRSVIQLQMPEDFIKVHLQNPEEASIEGIEYYFNFLSHAFQMNFHVTLASGKSINSLPFYVNEDLESRDLVYFNQDQTTIYLLQEVKPKPTRSIPLLKKTLDATTTSLKTLVDLLKSYKIKRSKEYRAEHEREKKKYDLTHPRYKEFLLLGNLGVRARDSKTQCQELLNNVREYAYELRSNRTFQHSHFSNALTFISSHKHSFGQFSKNVEDLRKRYQGEEDEKEEQNFLITSINNKGLLQAVVSEAGSKCEKCHRKTPKSRVPVCGHSLCQECLRDSVLIDSKKHYFTSEFSKTGALLLKCPIKGCYSLIDYRLVTNVFTGNRTINDEFERYINEYSEGKDEGHPIVSKMCMSCKEDSRTLFGATDSHNEHRMCLTCWKNYVDYWESKNMPLACPFYECIDNIKMDPDIQNRIKGKSTKMSCSHCKKFLSSGTDCCGGPLCSGCTELNAKNQYYNGRNMVCPLCGKSLTQFTKVAEEKKWPKLKRGEEVYCEICYDSHNDEQFKIIRLPCGHNFCQQAIQKTLAYEINENDMKNLGCPSCQKPIPAAIIHNCLTEADNDRLNRRKIERDFNIIHCSNAKCNFNAQIDENTQKTMKYFKCLQCKTKTCLKCKDQWHPGKACDSQQIIKNFRETRLAFGDQIVMACPYCLAPFIKDEACEHVTCGNTDCAKDFCFKGSCKRSPTLSHGNHYHRPDCEYYSAYDDSKEKAHPKCDECKRLGHKCPRPKELDNGFIPQEEWPQLY